MEKRTFSRRAAALLLVLLLCAAGWARCGRLGGPGSPAARPVSAAARRSKPASAPAEEPEEEQEGLRLTLCRGQGAAAEPFQVENMLPGDGESRLYCVRTYHREEVKLHFAIKNLRATGELERALCLRVTRLADGAVLCDGPVAEVLGAVDSAVLPAGTGFTDSWYSVEAYLPAETGNEYQQTRLLADLEWYCEETGSLTSPGGAGWLGSWTLPQTGDGFPFGALLLAAALCLCALALLAGRRRRAAAPAEPLPEPPAGPLPEELPQAGSAARRLMRLGAAVLVLLGLLAATTFALAAASVQVEDNRFETAQVELALYKAAEHPLAGTADALAEPGKTMIHTFELVNNSTVDVYCRLYLDRAEGPLCGYVTFTVAADGQTYTASASAFTRRQAYTLPDPLAPGERRTVEVRITMPAHTGNAAQDAWLTYSLAADATQRRNNPNRLFGTNGL